MLNHNLNKLIAIPVQTDFNITQSLSLSKIAEVSATSERVKRMALAPNPYSTRPPVPEPQTQQVKITPILNMKAAFGLLPESNIPNNAIVD